MYRLVFYLDGDEEHILMRTPRRDNRIGLSSQLSSLLVGLLKKLRLKGQSPNQSSPGQGSAHVIRACLANSEMIRWQAHNERVPSVGNSDDDCSQEEKRRPRNNCEPQFYYLSIRVRYS